MCPEKSRLVEISLNSNIVLCETLPPKIGNYFLLIIYSAENEIT